MKLRKQKTGELTPDTSHIGQQASNWGGVVVVAVYTYSAVPSCPWLAVNSCHCGRHGGLSRTMHAAASGLSCGHSGRTFRNDQMFCQECIPYCPYCTKAACNIPGWHPDLQREEHLFLIYYTRIKPNQAPALQVGETQTPIAVSH